MEKELAKSRQELDWYNKAYGAGFFSMEQLREYTKDVQEKTSSLESKIAAYKSETMQPEALITSRMFEIKQFAHAATKTLPALNFIQRKAIVDNVIDKVIGTKTELEVFGHIPVENHELQTLYWYCGASKCW
ncbi:MAG: hypothetical protein KBC26_00580 [Candidatus Pacebacteria bacterium]|nr:hypothetical protein [Candidatus Paceibacterota bacterium]